MAFEEFLRRVRDRARRAARSAHVRHETKRIYDSIKSFSCGRSQTDSDVFSVKTCDLTNLVLEQALRPKSLSGEKYKEGAWQILREHVLWHETNPDSARFAATLICSIEGPAGKEWKQAARDRRQRPATGAEAKAGVRRCMKTARSENSVVDGDGF